MQALLMGKYFVLSVAYYLLWVYFIQKFSVIAYYIVCMIPFNVETSWMLSMYNNIDTICKAFHEVRSPYNA